MSSLSISIQLKALYRASLLQKKKVRVIDDFISIDDGANKINLSKGQETELEFWLAKELQDQNKVKILDTITLEELGRISFQEKQSRNSQITLVEIPKDFYIRIGLLIKELNTKNDLVTLGQLNKVIQLANEIIPLRKKKILQLAFLSSSEKELYKNLTTEELLIYMNMRKLVNVDFLSS